MNRPTEKYTAFIKRLAFTALLAYPFTLQAACDSGVPLTTPKEHFTNNRDGTVTDNTTGLMWTLCLYGQAGSDCSAVDGKIGNLWLDTWDNAQTTYFSNHLGHNDWRIPNVKELASLLEASCTQPALNPAVFPAASGTVEGPIWSSSPHMSFVNGIWVVDFRNDGEVYAFDRANTGHLRLVRDADKVDMPY